MKTVFWKQLYASFEAFLDADGSRPDEGRLEKIFYILSCSTSIAVERKPILYTQL